MSAELQQRAWVAGYHGMPVSKTDWDIPGFYEAYQEGKAAREDFACPN